MPSDNNDFIGGIVVYPPKNKMTAVLAIIPIGDSNLTSTMLVKQKSQITGNIALYSDYAIDSISPLRYASQRKANLRILNRSNITASLGVKPNGIMSAIIDVLPQPVTTLILNPIADAFVRQAVPTLNYGEESVMQVGYNTSYSEIYRSMIKFNMSDIPIEQTIISATLKLYNNTNALSDQQIGVFDAYNTWTETGVTWNNQPYINSLIASQNFGSTRGYVNYDITNLVKDWYDGSVNNHGLIIKALNESIAQYLVLTSRENSSDTKPTLIITYNDTNVYTYERTNLTSSIYIIGHVEKDLPASLNIRLNDNERNLPSNLSVHQASDIVIQSFPSNIAVKREQITSNIVARRSDMSEITASIFARQKLVSEITGNIVINAPERTANIYVPYRSDITANIIIKSFGESDITSNLAVIRREIPSSIYILYRDDFPSSIHVRGLANNDFISQVGVSRKEIIGNITARRSDKIEITGSITVKREGVNNFNSSFGISRPDLPSNIQTGLSSYFDGNITVRTLINRDFPSNIYVLNRGDFTSNLTIIGASKLPSNIFVLSGFIRANIQVPTHQTNSLPASLTIRVRFIKDLSSTIRIGGDNIEEGYVYIM